MSHTRLLTSFAVSCCQLLLLLSCAAADRQVRFDYIGCFVDYAGGVRDINGLVGIQQWSIYGVNAPAAQVDSPIMTWQYCSSVCSLGGFAFMGLQSRVSCFCGNSYGSQGSGGTICTTSCDVTGCTASCGGTSCTSPCGGNSSQICGASSLNSVFSLTYIDDNRFIRSARSLIKVISSYTEPLYWTASALTVIECTSLCRAGCQAVIFNRQQSLCHLLRFALVPAALNGTAGDFFARC